MNHSIQVFCLLGVNACLLVLIGCGGGQNFSVADLNRENIQRLRNAYALYETSVGRPPKNEEEFKDFLTSDRGTRIRLDRMGVTQDMVDSIFISERDNQPFVVRYGVSGMGDQAIIFEAQGVGGMRMVGFFEPEELDSVTYDGYLSGRLKRESKVEESPF